MLQIWPPGELVRVFNNMGRSSKLGLNGRPARPIGDIILFNIFSVFNLILIFRISGHQQIVQNLW